MVNVLLFVVAAIICREAIDLSHDEESVLSAYGDHEGGEVVPSQSAHRREVET